MAASPGLITRPYQLLCSICALAAEQACTDCRGKRVLAMIRSQPDGPLTLRCNAGEIFSWQDPGENEDLPGESPEFNLKRDLEILHRINLFPGATLTPRIVMNRILDRIEDVNGLCAFETETGPAWKSACPHAISGSYRRGRAKGIHALIPPRPPPVLAEDKRQSIERMLQGPAVKVRPHILACAVCQFGNGTRPPYAEDNLPELLQVILRKPETMLELAPHADWSMCAPCPYRAPELNACVHNKGSGGLPNQMRDLRVLQAVGLTFGATIQAKAFFRLLFERIPGTLSLCKLDHPAPSVWYTGCGSADCDSPNYEKGRQELTALLGL